VKQMTMTPHPFHIVGECQDCCDESEALRLGYPDPAPMLLGCETPGCVNANDELSPITEGNNT
jgi:hypothetical protein